MALESTTEKFSAEANRVVLFPTYEHQKPELLKAQYQSAVTPVPPGWHPETITLKAWAEITHIFLTDDANKVEAIAPFHIWQPDLAQTRLKWKPNQPLYVLALRAHRFHNDITLPWQPTYGGCRSWVTLASKLDLPENAVIKEERYLAQVKRDRSSTVVELVEESATRTKRPKLA